MIKSGHEDKRLGNLIPDNRAQWLLLSVCLMAAVWVVDIYTPQRLSIFVLNLIPVSLTAWFVGRSWALVLVTISCVAWFIGVVIIEANPDTPTLGPLNFFVQSMLFFTCAWTVGALRDSLLLTAERNRQLAEANGFLTSFLAMAAHDLRSPLNSIIMSAEMLEEHMQENGDRESETSYLPSLIVKSGRRMNVMLENYLDHGRIQFGAFNVSKRPVLVATWLQRLCDEMRPLASEAEITIDCQNAGAEGMEARFDPDLLELALQNLLTNAIKYSGPGTCIRLLVRQTDRHLTFQVADEGPGLSEDPDHLFEMFHSGKPSESSNAKSTGLGLYIVRKAVHVHGGSVDAGNNPSRGAWFEITLPNCIGPSPV